jgi:hypothetical protein
MPELVEDSNFYEKILPKELEWINERRTALGREWIKPTAVERPTAKSDASVPYSREDEHKSDVKDTIGLALSGGGIRSSAFCLGALQALDVHDVLKYVDYLSTVSGGGYVGSSLTAGMTVEGERESQEVAVGGKNSTGYSFPFDSKLDQKEAFAVQHIRNFSNYLFPSGKRDLLDSVAIYLRGIAANVIIVLPWLLLAAAITIYSLDSPGTDADRKFLWVFERPSFIPNHFVASTLLAVALIVGAMTWALVRSVRTGLSQEVPNSVTLIYGTALFVVLFVAFCELQPFLLARLFEGADTPPAAVKSGSYQQLLVILAPLIAVGGLLWRQFKAYIEKEIERVTGRWRAILIAQLRWLVMVCVLPALLWAAYLVLTAWGIPGAKTTPPVLAAAATAFADVTSCVFGTSDIPMARLYLGLGLVFFAMSMVLAPNANSLHRLYRDRLSKAFLFDPRVPKAAVEQAQAASLPAQQKPPTSWWRGSAQKQVTEREILDEDLPPLGNYPLSKLSRGFAPYHIINAALNLQGSKFANRRGRNADFFMFTPRYVGSAATGYVETVAMEESTPDLGLATALAISGAAASANMGGAGVRALAPTLALLNVRLGFWLPNPRAVADPKMAATINRAANWYFLQEMTGQLDEEKSFVYLTDGGHIENLGAYELLKRRCHLVIVIDAEADPDMNFDSLITLQRYARIDLGARIELPWEPIRERTLQAGKEYADAKFPKQMRGPHCAVGKILYDDDQVGYLIYVKSSFSGDENDYVRDYKRRNSTFPHESTSDQAFTEEQFEAYRALGFHAVYRMFKGEDAIVLHSNLDGKQNFSTGLDQPLETSLLGTWSKRQFVLPPGNEAQTINDMICEAIGGAREAAAKAATPTPAPRKSGRSRKATASESASRSGPTPGGKNE